MSGSWLIAGIVCALGGAAHAGAASCAARGEACTTASVVADPRGHFVHVAITGAADWAVIEVATGVVVGHGRTTSRGLDHTIFGLAGRYALRLTAPAARGTIASR